MYMKPDFIDGFSSGRAQLIASIKKSLENARQAKVEKERSGKAVLNTLSNLAGGKGMNTRPKK